MFVLVLAFGLFARRKAWTNPATASFWLSTGVVLIATVLMFAAKKPAAVGRPDASFLQNVIPVLVGGVSFVGAVAATFHELRRRRVAIIMAGTALAAFVAYPLAFLVMMYAACMAGLGCI